MTSEALHRQTAERVHSAMTAAMRADADRLTAALSSRADLGRFDGAFVREARNLVLALAAALNTVLRVHRRGDDPYGANMCVACGSADCRTLRAVAEALAAYKVRAAPIDRAEAWRRADHWFAREVGRPGLPVTVEEFGGGVIARVQGRPHVLVLDRFSGSVTLWPSIATAELVQAYAHRKRPS